MESDLWDLPDVPDPHPASGLEPRGPESGVRGPVGSDLWDLPDVPDPHAASCLEPRTPDPGPRTFEK